MLCILKCNYTIHLHVSGEYQGLLLGDSGYALKPYLITPLLNPANPQEERFNRAQMRSRVVIEQTFGILKRRFTCLHDGLRVNPQRACEYVVACAVLHNFGIAANDILPPVDNDALNPDADAVVHLANDGQGATMRRQLIQLF
jgi:hypothetical protein